MKKREAIVTYFFVAWGIILLLILKKDIDIEYGKLIIWSLVLSIPVTILCAIARQPVLNFYRSAFNKEYKYHMPSKKR